MKTLFLLLLSLSLFASAPTLKESQYTYVKSSIGQGKPYFLEVGSKGCKSCKIMGKMLYKATQKYPKYQIHFINVSKERDAAQALKIRMIPTQIIYNAVGEEVYRHVGVLGTQELETLLEQHFKEN